MKNKDNLKTTSLSKLTLKMAAGAIVGAILGASAAVLLSINNGNSFNQAAQKLISGIQNMIFPGLLLITVLSIILQEIYYSRLKNICNSLADADDEEFDELDYKEKKDRCHADDQQPAVLYRRHRTISIWLFYGLSAPQHRTRYLPHIFNLRLL